MRKEEEVALILKAQSDLSALAPLYEKYINRVLGYVYRKVLNQAVAEDITAQTFEKVMVNIGQFKDQSWGFGAWVYSIAANLVADYYRKKSRQVEVDFDDWSSLIGDESSPQEYVEKKEESESLKIAVEKLLVCMQSLSLEDESLISMRFLEGLSNKEIAQQWGIDNRHVAVKVHRSLEKLRKIYEQKEYHESA